jgi:DNA-binding response OmpR family regulator
MPELPGSAFYDLLTRQYPDLRQRVIFMTGDTVAPESVAFLQQCGQPWLQKPFTIAEVRTAIAQVLHAP